MRSLRNSLRLRTLLIVGGTAVLTAALFIMITLSITQRQMEQQARASLDELIDAMSSMASIACFAQDVTLANETAQSFLKSSAVARVSISAGNSVLALATRPDAQISAADIQRSITRQVSSPFNEGEEVGQVRLTPNWPEINRRIERMVRYGAGMMVALACCLVGAVALSIGVLVIQPVKNISDQLHALDAAEGGMLGQPLHHEDNELGRLVLDINALLGRFRSALQLKHEMHLAQVLHERTRLSAAVFEHSQEGIIITDADNRIVTVNEAFSQITGYSTDEAVGQSPNFIASGRHDKDFYAQMWASILGTGHWKGELWNRDKQGEIRPYWYSISVVRDNGGAIANYVAIFSDITEHRLALQRIEFLAHHDTLTNLPNRVLTLDRFQHASATARRDGTGVALLYIDLDNFKYVNDSFGHKAGDQLLKIAAERLKQQVRETDTVSRQGGDEFLVILPNVADEAVVLRIAAGILEALARSFEIEGHALGISASIGITLFPQHGKDFDTLLKNADAAMYAAKAAGKNTCRQFTEDMNVDALDKLKLKALLGTAIENDEFRLVFQPQINIETKAIVGAEALIRWRHPEQGEISPARFIPLAEESGLIVPIGRWVIEEACRQGKQWFDAGLGPFVVAVNVSAQQFNNGDILGLVEEILYGTGFPAHYLELEFTESGLLNDICHSISTIEQLKSLGVKLAIDDFGTGYSSLSYLKQFKVEKLKIDQSFVRDIGVNAESLEIIRAIIQLGKTLRLEVIAEGVETENQLQTLRALDCNEAQGYLISKPLPAADWMAFYQSWMARHGMPSGSVAPSPQQPV
ncbi:putative bifunctional diguanylate cyclase/phosphodiesterase [Uliginosibacterium sediminicola]|uniref:EAL domain-containing protein n=1 Tax=Uliginosibacterium sediminicola TaxID=2024550 RepID=A0ABU9YYP5_9RHOO